MLLAIHLGMAALFVLLGILFLRGKGTSLIAGYNTASPQEKAATDEKKLCRYMGKLMFALAGCLLIAAVSEVVHNRVFLWIGMAAFLLTAVVGAILANTGDRFRKDPE